MTDRTGVVQPRGLQPLQALLESGRFQKFITALIVVNAVILGLETSREVMDAAGGLLITIDHVILSVFVAELLAKVAVYRGRFHKDPWNIFDFVVVGIALVPASGHLSVLRALRVLRVLRLVSAVPSMRRVVEGLLAAIPGMGSVAALLVLIFYVFAVMATQMYGGQFPEWFGSVGASMYSLFQIMTLESWSMGIVRPVMEVSPYAWAFFVPFILVTSFAVLNLFIAIIVSAMGEQNDEAQKTEIAEITGATHGDTALLLAELRELKDEVRALKGKLP